MPSTLFVKSGGNGTVIMLGPGRLSTVHWMSASDRTRALNPARQVAVKKNSRSITMTDADTLQTLRKRVGLIRSYVL